MRINIKDKRRMIKIKYANPSKARWGLSATNLQKESCPSLAVDKSIHFNIEKKIDSQADRKNIDTKKVM